MSSQALTLTAEERTVTGKKVKKLRRDGLVPAVVYERGQASDNIMVPYMPLAKAWHTAGKHHVIQLSYGKKERPTLIQHMTLDPVKGTIAHVTFHAIKMNEKVETEIPVHLVGNAPAAQKGLIVHQNLEAVTVKGLPGNMPDAIELDISSISEPEDDLKVSALVIPSDLELITDPEHMLVSVIIPRAEVEAVAEEVPADEVPSDNGGEKPSVEAAKAE
jgi:large subunit ribosomal protein L25